MKSLKIAMLVRQFSAHGGLELYAHKVVEGLLSQGVRVTVVCQEKDSDLQNPDLDFKMIENASANDGAKKPGAKTARLEHLFKTSNEALKTLTDVDLIHSQHCPTSEADVVTFHNHTTERLSKVGLWWEVLLNDTKRSTVPAYRLRDSQDEILCRRALSLIFPAEIMKEDFFSHFPFLDGLPAKPYVVAHPGSSLLTDPIIVSEDVSLSASENGESSLASSEFEFNFLFVGRGFRKKGLDVLFQACALLKARSEQKFNLLIAGLKEKAADTLRLRMMGLSGTVHYLGFQKDMESVFSRARVIILPSRVEPFGMAPVQGMQRGLVPIISRVSGVCETLRDEHDALVLEDQLNASELAEHMQRLMTDRELLDRLSINAIASSSSITWDETVKQTLKAYELALSVKKSGNTLAAE